MFSRYTAENRVPVSGMAASIEVVTSCSRSRSGRTTDGARCRSSRASRRWSQAPTPVEFLLHGLAGCITAGIANIAAARGVTLTEVTSRIEGDIDLNGTLGLNKDVRNGYQKIRASFDVKGDAPAETLREIVRQSQARSAVLDVLTNGVPVEIAVNAA